MENCKNVYLKSNTRVKGRGTMYLYLPQTYVTYYFVILAQKSEMKSRLPYIFEYKGLFVKFFLKK